MKPCFLLAVPGIAFALQASAAPETYKIEPTHTFANWEVRHMGNSTSRGRFDQKSGSITLDRVAKTGTADISIEIASISTGWSGFDDRVRRLLDAENHPVARFVSSDFKFEGERLVGVAGSLTFRGITNPVTLKADFFDCYFNSNWKLNICGGDFSATIKRSKWGSTEVAQFAADEVKLIIQIEAIRQDDAAIARDAARNSK